MSKAIVIVQRYLPWKVDLEKAKQDKRIPTSFTDIPDECEDKEAVLNAVNDEYDEESTKNIFILKGELTDEQRRIFDSRE